MDFSLKLDSLDRLRAQRMVNAIRLNMEHSGSDEVQTAVESIKPDIKALVTTTSAYTKRYAGKATTPYACEAAKLLAAANEGKGRPIARLLVHVLNSRPDQRMTAAELRRAMKEPLEVFGRALAQQQRAAAAAPVERATSAGARAARARLSV